MREHFHHVADVGIRGIGQTVEEAFAEGGLALTEVMCDIARVRQSVCVEVACEAEEPDLLFADWINALIYEMDVRKMVFGRYEVHIDGHCLYGKAWGERIEPERHEIAVGVKAATYLELKVYRRDDGQWAAQCVVDV